MTSPHEIRAAAITGLETVACELRKVEAHRFDLLMRGYQSLPPGEMESRSYRAEAALALGLTEYRVDTLLGLAAALTTEYRDTAALLREGRVSVTHAEIITQAGTVITNLTATGITAQDQALTQKKLLLAAARRTEYEHAVLVYALKETPNRLKPIAKRLAAQWAVEPIEQRQAAETARRRVTVVQLDDGMAELRVYLPAAQALGVHDHLTRIAKAVQRGSITAPPTPGTTPAAGTDAAASAADAADAADTRGLDEIRVDALFDLLTRDPFQAAATADRPVGAELQGRVQLVVTAEGLDALLTQHCGTIIRDTPAPDTGAALCELQGYGPVSLDAARTLLATTRPWELVTVCAHTGAVIRTDTYRPTNAQTRFLTARDGHCRFPGCVAPTIRADIDHTIEYALGGDTATDNLAYLCRKHHTLKGNSDWDVEQLTGGVMKWTSPSGRVYFDWPPDRLPERRNARAPGSRPRTAPRERACEPAREPVLELAREPARDPVASQAREPAPGPAPSPAHEPVREPSGSPRSRVRFAPADDDTHPF